MSKDHKKNQDMSVEEILKSIKGMIDNRSGSPSNDDDILELTNIARNEEDNAHISLEEELLNASLISDKSAAETTKIFQHFSKTAREINSNTSNSKGKTLEDLIVEMIRPQLSQWLDKNLPLLVKQLVEKEIQKLLPNDQK
jgi:cell pole-organizing protein PopZ